MVKKRELTEDERAEIVLLYSQGVTQSEIAKKMKCSRCAVQITIKRYSETGSFVNREKSGRRRKTNVWEDKIVGLISGDKKKASKDISSELLDVYGINLSARSIRRRFVQHNNLT